MAFLYPGPRELKEFNPMDFVHGKGNGKNRNGQYARFAIVLPVPGKSSRAPPRTKLGGAFCFYLVAMGTTVRLTPHLTHCSWPQTP